MSGGRYYYRSPDALETYERRANLARNECANHLVYQVLRAVPVYQGLGAVPTEHDESLCSGRIAELAINSGSKVGHGLTETILERLSELNLVSAIDGPWCLCLVLVPDEWHKIHDETALFAHIASEDETSQHNSVSMKKKDRRID